MDQPIDFDKQAVSLVLEAVWLLVSQRREIDEATRAALETLFGKKAVAEVDSFPVLHFLHNLQTSKYGREPDTSPLPLTRGVSELLEENHRLRREVSRLKTHVHHYSPNFSAGGAGSAVGVGFASDINSGSGEAGGGGSAKGVRADAIGAGGGSGTTLSLVPEAVFVEERNRRHEVEIRLAATLYHARVLVHYMQEVVEAHSSGDVRRYDTVVGRWLVSRSAVNAVVTYSTGEEVAELVMTLRAYFCRARWGPFSMSRAGRAKLGVALALEKFFGPLSADAAQRFIDSHFSDVTAPPPEPEDD